MKRIIIVGTMALLAFVTAWTAFGHDILFPAFAGSDMISQFIRLALIGLLGCLLIIPPPRSMELRTVLALVSAGLTFGVTIMLSQYYMAMLDAVLYVEVAIILAIEAIEAPLTLRSTNEKTTQVAMQKVRKS